MRIPDLAMASEILGRILHLDATRLYGKMKLHNDERLGFMWVKRKVTEEEAERLQNLKLEWIEFRTESKRVYAYGGLAAHVLGGVDFEEKGNSGIEQSLDEDLTGHAGAIRVTTDVKQRGYDSKLDTEATPGKTVRLTILSRLQYIAEEELKKAVKKCTTASRAAWWPWTRKTGEILALANYPSYDPNSRPKPGRRCQRPRESGGHGAVRAGLGVQSDHHFGGAGDHPHLRPETVVSCGNGSITLFGRTIHDHNSYASLPVEDVLARSSNIGAINIGLKVGDAQHVRLCAPLRIRQAHGHSAAGRIARACCGRLKRWQKSSIGSVAMGHEISVTIGATGAGLLRDRQRRLPGEAQAGDGMRRRAEPVQVLKSRRPPSPCASMMEGVVIKPYGTGHRTRTFPGTRPAAKPARRRFTTSKSHVYTHLTTRPSWALRR